jgi:hypothetical protein
MEIAQLLDILSVRDYIEVVVTSLPELVSVPLDLFGYLRLEYVECRGEWMVFWLREQEVNVLRHKNVSKQIEAMTPTKRFNHLLCDDAAAVVGEIRKSVVATEGDEMEVATTLIALKLA